METNEYMIPARMNDKILLSLRLRKQLKLCEDEIKINMLKIMDADGVNSLATDDYTIAVGTRKNYTPDNDVPIEFQKIVLDTSKVSSHVKLYNEIPLGIHQDETKYLTWRERKESIE